MQNTHDLLVGTLSIGIPSILFYLFLLQVIQTRKIKKKLHRMNKVIKGRKKLRNYTLTWQYLQILN